MRQETHPIRELLFVLTEVGLTVVGVGPLYFIGQRAAKAVVKSKALGTLNGTLCASISFPFSFQLTELERKSLPQQWKIANKWGKFFIASTSAIALTTAGIANCYYMEGNTALKSTALVFPGIAARRIVANGLLRSHLAINALIRKSSYRNTYHALQLLTDLSNNLIYNDTFSTDTHPEIARLIIAADRNLNRLPAVIAELKILANSKDLIVTNHPIKSAIKFTIFGVIGGLAGYFMFFNLGPRAGACIFGSNLQFHSDQENDGAIICPIESDLGKQIGTQLGHITYAIQTCVAIFPLITLFNIQRTSSRNEWNWGRSMTYLVTFILAIFRATIAPYIASQNNENNQILGWLVYIAAVYFFLNFLSMAIYGPATLKTIFNTLKNTCQQLCSPAGTKGEKTGLLTEGASVSFTASTPSAAETLAACGQLQHQCLFHPTVVNKVFNSSTDRPETGIHPN